MHGELRSAYKFSGDHLEDRDLWEDNIKMDFGEIECDDVVWIDLSQA
jgi:hypothetical protein